MESIFHFLLARKRAYYSHIQRLIMDCELTHNGSQFHIQVVSSMYEIE